MTDQKPEESNTETKTTRRNPFKRTDSEQLPTPTKSLKDKAKGAATALGLVTLVGVAYAVGKKSDGDSSEAYPADEQDPQES